MLRNTLSLALLAAALVAPVAARANDGFLSRALTARHDEGRWINRRLTLRHHDQDAPAWAGRSRHEDGFLGRAFTARHDEGRWINRRLTLRHEGQDAPRVG